MTKSLSHKQILAFRAQAHHLHPVVLLGEKGLTDNVVQEADLALLAHELIKVKINGADRDQRNQIAKELTERCNASIIQTIGRMVVLYRKNENKEK